MISRTSLINRARYSVTHHSVIGLSLFADAGRRDEAIPKYLHLHEHEKHPEAYAERERVVLDYTAKVTKDAHLVTDQEFQELRRVLTEHNLKDDQLKNLTTEEMSRHVDAQIVELTWLIGHFCLLNRWFTALQYLMKALRMNGILPRFTRKSYPNKSVVAMIRSLLVVSDKCVTRRRLFSASF